MTSRTSRVTSLFLLLLLPLMVGAQELTGRVVRVIDGDTLVLLDASDTQHKIRLAGIDCPEKGQPWSVRAKEALSEFVFDRRVTVDWNKRDRYKRIVGKVIRGDADVNLALVSNGLCWWYRKYADEQSVVGRAIWVALSAPERARALRDVEPLLRSSAWPDDWPARLTAGGERALRVAALLVEAGDSQLETNLYRATEPRVTLKHRHPLGFAAYERPGELSGSALLCHPAAITPYAEAIVRHAAAEGLAYVELRGSPQKYGDRRGFLRAFRSALQQAAANLPAEQRPLLRFTIIADRRDRTGMAAVVAMAVAAKAEFPDFIAGIDLAGDEGTTRPDEIAPTFLPAIEACLPITIHAGETESADAIWQAAYHLHADRIGHGLTLGEHPQLATRFRDRGICLELCPTSNREVVGFHDPAVPESAGLPDYPLAALWRQGLPLTLCTDNPGISRTTLTDEYLAAARMMADGLRVWDALAILKQGFVHAFLPSDDKERLLKRADTLIYRYALERFETES